MRWGPTSRDAPPIVKWPDVDAMEVGSGLDEAVNDDMGELAQQLSLLIDISLDRPGHRVNDERYGLRVPDQDGGRGSARVTAEH
jgi:hypothetical protein